jgi:ribosomal protein L31
MKKTIHFEVTKQKAGIKRKCVDCKNTITTNSHNHYLCTSCKVARTSRNRPVEIDSSIRPKYTWKYARPDTINYTTLLRRQKKTKQ